MRRALLICLLMAVTCAGAGYADWQTGLGCFVCLPHDFGVDSDDKCWFVGHEENGDGTSCQNPYFIDGHVCIITGDPCFNVNVNGGGGGGSAGGSGSSCVVPFGSGCPAECSSCTQEKYPRMAV